MICVFWRGGEDGLGVVWELSWFAYLCKAFCIDFVGGRGGIALVFDSLFRAKLCV